MDDVSFKAFEYAFKRREYLGNYFENGNCAILNNIAENAIRPFTVGRKNWQLIDTVNGAQESAVVYSIVATAKANKLKPYDYLKYLLTERPDRLDKKNSKLNLDDLLHWSSDLRPSAKRKPNRFFSVRSFLWSSSFDPVPLVYRLQQTFIRHT